MSSAVLTPRVSVANYLEREELATEKHELHEGEVMLMSGGSDRHGLIGSALNGLLFAALRRKPCTFLNADNKVVVFATGSHYYPDSMIACPPNFVNRSSGVIDNPTVIFEVLSPSTAAFDRGPKFRAYEQIPSLQDYVLIESEDVFVEVFSRQSDGTWRRTTFSGQESIAKIPSVNIEIALSELYESVS
jgi:Uma2 family endonuclease